MKFPLAIVIPAIKHEFLSEALESVAQQTCRDFTLYVGDESESHRLKEIVSGFSGKLEINFKKFETNLGSNDLVSQWSRCVDLTEGEEYIWLFSDDDLMPPDAVQRFYFSLKSKQEFDLRRFNIRQVDESGKPLSGATAHPSEESSESFLIRRLKGETLSAACEYIFSREIYNTSGGFVSFPLAWCTDDASWFKFGKGKGILTLDGDPVLWRMSSINISAPLTNRKLKLKATLMFLQWIRRQGVADELTALIPYALKRQSAILAAGLRDAISNLFRIIGILGIQGSISYFVFLLRLKRRRVRK